MASKITAITAIREFNRFYTNLLGLLNQHIYDSSYSLSEVRVMYEINHSSGCTAKSIKNILQIDEGYLSRILDKFVRDKLVKKSKSPEDGRVTFLSLTSTGKATFGQLNQASDSSIANLISSLPANDIQSLTGMMAGIQKILSQP